MEESRGSAYYPTNLSCVVQYILDHPGKYAAIGVPCFVKALRLAQLRNKTIRERLVIIAGLTCGQMKSSHFTDYISYISCGEVKQIASVHYRSKDCDSSTNPFTYTYTYTDGSSSHIKFTDGVSNVWGNRAFTLPACNYCDDVFAECADITFMDAWLPEYHLDKRGTSLWIIRSKLAKEIIDSGIDNGLLYCNPVDMSSVISAWKILIYEKRNLVSYRLAITPTDIKKRVAPNARSANIINKYICKKRLRILNISREANLKSLSDYENIKSALDTEFRISIPVRFAKFTMAAMRYAIKMIRCRK